MATNPNTAPRRQGTNPAGRVDVFATNLLERAVLLHGDMIVRTIYGTFKPEIDRAIKGQLRGIKVCVPEMLRYPSEVAAAPAGKEAKVPKTPKAKIPKPARPAPDDAGIMDMRVGEDGVYEVSDAQ